LNHRQRLRPDENLSAIEAVNPNAGKRRNQKRGNLPGKANRAQQQRGVSQAEDQPRRGDARHPRANQGDGLSAEK